MFKQLAIMDYENKKVILTRISSTETTEETEEYITEQLGLSLDQCHYMIADDIRVEW